MTAALYCLPNARSEAQAAEMRRLAAAGRCLFCPAAGPDPAVRRTGFGWSVRPNDFPYAGTSVHLLLVPDEHVTDLVDLSPPAWVGLRAALLWVRGAYGLDAYGVAARCGDPARTGATVAHVHLHVLVGDPSGPDVRVRLSSTIGETS